MFLVEGIRTTTARFASCLRSNRIISRTRRAFATDEKPRKQSFADQARAPLIFGLGLYLGMVLFSDRKEGNESDTLKEMKNQFRNDKES